MKILIGFVEDLLHSGIDKYLCDICDIFCENGIRPDFLTSQYSENAERFLSERKCRLFAVPSLKKPLSQIKSIRKIIRENSVDAVYINISEPLNCLALIAAKKEKVKRIIVHSHSSGVDRESQVSRKIRDIISSFCRPIIRKCANEFFSCSDKASEYMFGKAYADKAEIIYNSVDLPKYRFSEEIRNEKRKELSVEGKNVYLFVGNFCYQKNIFFMLDVFSKIAARDENAFLLAAGKGRLSEEVKKYAEERIGSKIKLLGVRSDIPEIMSASDALLLPSRFEGLPFTAVESQASGLYTFVSDRITKYAAITDKIFFLPIDDPEKWADEILKCDIKNRGAASFNENAENFDSEKRKEKLVELFKIKS